MRHKYSLLVIFLLISSLIKAQYITLSTPADSDIEGLIPGYYETKWGNGPVMRHKPNYGPMLYQTYHKKYYIPKATIAQHLHGHIFDPNMPYLEIAHETDQLYPEAMGDYKWSVSGPNNPLIDPNRYLAHITFFSPGTYYITCSFITNTGQEAPDPDTVTEYINYAPSVSLFFDTSAKTIALVSQGDKTQMAASATKGYAYQIANLSTGALVANGLIAPDGSKISVATLQPGIYVCKIQIDAETTLIEKLIIR